MSKKTTAFCAAAAVAALAAGAYYFQGSADAPASPAPAETANPIPPKVERRAPSDGPAKAASIYKVVESPDGSRLAPVETDLPPGKEPMAAALNAMANLKEEESPLPPGTRVRSVDMVGDGVAFVNFNKALVDNFPGGDQEEALTINAVLATLAQFPGVERVQFLIEGKKIETIGGHQDLSGPLPVASQTAQGAAR